MNENKLSKIKDTLSKTYSNIERLTTYGFDTTPIFEMFKNIDEKCKTLETEDYNINAAYLYESSELNLTYDLVSAFSNQISSLLSYCIVIDDAKYINLKLNDSMDIDDTLEYVTIMLNNLFNYSKLLDYGYKNKENEKLIFEVIYKLIKTEHIQTNSSTLYNALESFKFTSKLEEFIKTDLNKYENDKDISKIDINNTNYRDIISSVALIESLKKDSLLQKFKNVSDEYDLENRRLHIINDEENKRKKKIETLKSEYKHKRNAVYKRVFSFIASIIVLTSTDNVVNKLFVDEDGNTIIYNSEEETKIYLACAQLISSILQFCCFFGFISSFATILFEVSSLGQKNGNSTLEKIEKIKIEINNELDKLELNEKELEYARNKLNDIIDNFNTLYEKNECYSYTLNNHNYYRKEK